MSEYDGRVGSTDEERILAAVGRPVRFSYPGDEGNKRGILRDRVVVQCPTPEGAVPYWDVIDLIEFENEDEPNWIRVGYYRKPGQQLNWASQTTISERVSVWKTLLARAAREKPWFRDLLDDVMAEVTQASKTRADT